MSISFTVGMLKQRGLFVLEQWEKSFNLLAPRAFSLFVKASANAFYTALRQLCTSNWYIGVFLIFNATFIELAQVVITDNYSFLLVYIPVIMSLFAKFFLVMLVRPSIKIKKIKYFSQFFLNSIGCFLLAWFIQALVTLPFILWGSKDIAFIKSLTTIPFTLFSWFLFIDTEMDLFKALFKGFSIFLLLLPICLISSIVMLIPELLIALCKSAEIPDFIIFGPIFKAFLWQIVRHLFFLLQVAWYNTLYLKYLYEHIESYIN